MQFKPKEFSTPVNTFIIADTEGNEFKVTQVIKPGNEKHESVCAEKDESVCAEKDESVCVEKDESVCAGKDESVCVNSEERPQDTSEISCETHGKQVASACRSGTLLH